LIAAGISLLLTVCVVGSVIAAVEWRSSVRIQDRNAFDASSADFAASMSSAVHSDTDFVATLRSTLGTRPGMTNSALANWLGMAGSTTRYPGGVGYAYIARVPYSGLDAFKAKVVKDPPPGASPARPAMLAPSGVRANYCIIQLAGGSPTAKGALPLLPIMLDICASVVPGYLSQRPVATLNSAMDTGEFTTQPIDAMHGIFGLAAPLYRDGVLPRSVAERRATLLGWATGTFSGQALLATGSGVQRGMRVEIAHQNPGSESVVLASAGTATGSMMREVPVSADGSWMVRVTGSAIQRGMSAKAQYWIVLALGLLLSALVLGFVLVLVRSRGKALRMLARKTVELRYQALHDSLTGLANRALIMDRIDQALSRARSGGTPVAVISLDLDGFKAVNDTFGRAIGEQLLCAVSSRLIDVLSDRDTVGRLGGQEFAVLVEGDSLDAGPEVIAERIRDVLSAPFLLGTEDLKVAVRVNLGIAVGVRPDAANLMHDADLALYESKSLGKGHYVVFAPEMHALVRGRIDLEMDLRNAVTSDQFFLVYQPIFDLKSGVMNGVEALIRWQHPSRGVVMPDEFIPLAEQTALVVPMGRWVLAQACSQAADWSRRGHRLAVSVNVSGRQLDEDVDFVADVAAALTGSGLDPGLLTLEITETMLMRDADAVAERMHVLKALGVRLAIDDFGTGYSSLAYLQQFPVDSLKIDRSFVRGISDDPESFTLVQTMIQFGKALGIETLAEGIEEPAQLRRLRREECNSGQGYLYSRPVSVAALEELIDVMPALLVDQASGSELFPYLDADECMPLSPSVS
jgi:diguanylate cyclase (GGDEF)-like protein